jgi:hypothetical protein
LIQTTFQMAKRLDRSSPNSGTQNFGQNTIKAKFDLVNAAELDIPPIVISFGRRLQLVLDH